ncbi:unnamed protein product [Leptosia nina]|uniref:Uncharacterized protein n=1 Tax=Leptosia nina TaxID=320188 RepID=A0AAV1J2C8_9NEOP
MGYVHCAVENASFIQVIESGDEPAVCTSRRTLVLANHQSTADVPILMSTWNPRLGLLSNLMWIMDRVFKFTNFGIVSVLHKDFFIQARALEKVYSAVNYANLSTIPKGICHGAE